MSLEKARILSTLTIVSPHPLPPLRQVNTWDDFMAALDRRHMVLAPWADEEEVEEDVKKRSTTPTAVGAKTLCIPFDQPELPEGTLCFASGKPAKNWALWGRSY